MGHYCQLLLLLVCAVGFVAAAAVPSTYKLHHEDKKSVTVASPHGIIVPFNKNFVELAVASKSGFRVSISKDVSPTGAVPSPIVDTQTDYASFTKISNGTWEGIKTSFGVVQIDSSSGAFQMFDAKNNVIINTPLLSNTLNQQEEQSLKDNICKKAIDGYDAQGGNRASEAPNGLQNQNQSSCCEACNQYDDCDFFVYALPSSPDPSGANCWLLNNVQGMFKRPGRISGGNAPQPPPMIDFQLASSQSPLFYGSGGGAGDSLTQTQSDPFVSNTKFQAPYYWSTDKYSALGVSPLMYSHDNVVNYPASWVFNSQNVAWQISGSQADLYLLPAATPYDSLDALWDVIGRPRVLPRYAYGFLACRWGWTNNTYIKDILMQFRDGNFPIDAFISDFEWYTPEPDYNLPDSGSPTFEDFSYNNITFPDPKNELQEYRKQLNFRFGGIRKPRLGNSELLVMAKNKGWLISGRNLNYSIEALQTWYYTQHTHYLQDGVEFWWNDEGETQYFTFYWWNEAQVKGLAAFDKNKRFFTINRSYSPGMSRYGAAIWTGDIGVSFDSLAQQPGYQLNWLMSGASHITCDTGGFNGPNDPPLLLVRWYQTSLFLGVMRVHSTHDDLPHFPFLYGPEAAHAMRKALNMRYMLLPMHYSLAHAQYHTGRPIFRAMYFDYPEDTTVTTMTSQWMDGDYLMVSPVMSQDNSTQTYFPDGVWYNFNTTTTITGPTTVQNTNVALDHIPMYVKQGGIIPLGPLIQYTDLAPGGPLTIQIYDGADGSFTLYEDDGETLSYTSGDVLISALSWNSSTKVLTWKKTGSFSGKSFTSVQAMLFTSSGVQTSKPANFSSSGSIAF
eukprot:m.156347 g.156347  ORF g.156347 m.156347 type:complete len:842 (+) comp13338_c0_seq2:110-2635(+)